LLNKKENGLVEEKKNPHYDGKHMRYKREIPPAESKELETDPNYSLKKYTKQLLNKNITTDEYRQILKEHQINPNVEAINKILRQHESGKPAKFGKLLHAVIKHSDEKFDPTTVEYEITAPKFYKTSIDQDNSGNLYIPTKNGTSQMICFNKKNRPQSKFNSYISTKEAFDWDHNRLKMIQSGEIHPPTIENCPNGSKRIHQSQVFYNNDEVQETKSSSLKKSQNGNVFQGTGDIFSWKGDVKETNVKKKKEIVRRNPNETSMNSKQEEKVKPIKINKMMISSDENVLNRNGK